MTHICNYELDFDGQVTCVKCGAMDDDMDTRSNDDNSNDIFNRDNFWNKYEILVEL